MTPPRLLTTGRSQKALIATATATVIALVPIGVRAQTRANLDVSVGGTAASNPYLLNGSDTKAAGGNLTLAPSLTFLDGDTSVSLNGSVDLEKFADKYGLDESVQFGAKGEHRVNERTTISADVGFRSSESAARRFFGGADLSELEPGEFPDSPVLDPTLGSINGRTSRIDVNASVEHLLSPNSALTATAGMGLTKAESASGEDFRDANVVLNYSRQLTVRTSLLATIDAGYADYLGRQIGDGLFANGMAGVDHQFTESLHLSVQLGVSVAEVESLAGLKETSVSWAGNVDFCDRTARGALCARASRSAQPTSLGGLTTVNSVGVSYARSFGPVSSVSASATYSRTNRSLAAGFPLSSSHTELAAVSSTYRHKLGERLSAYLTPSFTSISDDFSGARENYQVLLGISYHFGPVR